MAARSTAFSRTHFYIHCYHIYMTVCSEIFDNKHAPSGVTTKKSIADRFGDRPSNRPTTPNPPSWICRVQLLSDIFPHSALGLRPAETWTSVSQLEDSMMISLAQSSRYSDWLRAGRPRGLSSRASRGKAFILSTSSRPALGITQLPIQWAAEALSPGVKRPGCEADQSPTTNAAIKKMWIYTSTPPYVFME
jgi:hypothetical protein